MAHFIDALDDAFRPELRQLGFERVRPRRWVRGAKAPIREIFEFQVLKGGVYSARWGFSLDFVPILRGGRCRWKRTSKAAAFDLCIDPVDDGGSIVDRYCVRPATISNEVRPEDVRRAAKAALQTAHRSFDRVGSVADIIAIIRERASMCFRRFSLENYVQTHLAWGLALVALGQHAEGETHLRQYCAQHGLERESRFIQKAVAIAARLGTSPG